MIKNGFNMQYAEVYKFIPINNLLDFCPEQEVFKIHISSHCKIKKGDVLEVGLLLFFGLF